MFYKEEERVESRKKRVVKMILDNYHPMQGAETPHAKKVLCADQLKRITNRTNWANGTNFYKKRNAYLS
jgi:hypothetical protein